VSGNISQGILSLSWSNQTVVEVVAAKKRICQEYLIDLSTRSLVLTIMRTFQIYRCIYKIMMLDQAQVNNHPTTDH
jgi:hypothetical protein